MENKMPISADERSLRSQFIRNSIRNKDNWDPVNVVILNRLRKRLKSIRKAHDHTQADLAELIGVPVSINKFGFRVCSTLSGYEIGDRRIPLNMLYLISKRYDISIDVFYQDAEPKIVPVERHENFTVEYKHTDDDIYKAVGSRMRYLRVISGAACTDLAKILNCSKNSAYFLEIAKTRIPIDQIYQIARHYNVLVSYFFQDLV
jgi:transcriptional regulator with XRE-family HTH domain